MRLIKLYTILLAALVVSACSQVEDLNEVQYKTATLSFTSGMSGLVVDSRAAEIEKAEYSFTLIDAANQPHNLSSSSTTNVTLKVKPNGEGVKITNFTISNGVAFVSHSLNGTSFADDNLPALNLNGDNNLEFVFKRNQTKLILDSQSIKIDFPWADDRNNSFANVYIASVNEFNSDDSTSSEFVFDNSSETNTISIIIGGTLTIDGKSVGTRYYKVTAYNLLPNYQYTITNITLTDEGSTEASGITSSSHISFDIMVSGYNQQEDADGSIQN